MMKRKVAVAAVAAALVAGGVTGWVVTDGQKVHNGPAIGSSDVSLTTSVTTAQLVNGRWDTLPAAPIVPRLNPVGLWDGREMFVWGGSPQAGPWRHDGATYDPITRAWSRLPTSPLSDRQSSAAVLAGDKVFIWGGTKEPSQATWLHDGAMYDPASRTWTSIPAGPHDQYQWAQALWTGKQVVLLTATTFQGVAATTPSRIHAHAYDPRTRVWTTLPDLGMPANEVIEYVTAVSTGRQIWVWPHWDHTVKTGPGSFETTAGVDTFVYDLSGSTWTSNDAVSQHGGSAESPMWTGSRIVIPFRTIWCGMGCSSPSEPSWPGLQIVPATSTSKPLPTGPVSSLRPSYLWTGADLLAYETDAQTVGGPNGIHHPGEGAVWDPKTGVWSKIPSAPLGGSQNVAVWTGGRLLIWGYMYDPIHPGEATPGGIEFVPQA